MSKNPTPILSFTPPALVAVPSSTDCVTFQAASGRAVTIGMDRMIDIFERADEILDTLEDEMKLREEIPAVKKAYDDYKLLAKMYRK